MKNPSPMLRCLGFVEEMKEVSSWPTWVCSMQEVNEAKEKGWLKELRRDCIHVRMQMWMVVYGITPEGQSQFLRLFATEYYADKDIKDYKDPPHGPQS